MKRKIQIYNNNNHFLQVKITWKDLFLHSTTSFDRKK